MHKHTNTRTTNTPARPPARPHIQHHNPTPTPAHTCMVRPRPPPALRSITSEYSTSAHWSSTCARQHKGHMAQACSGQ